MDINNITVNDAEALSCPPDRSPIFFVNIEADIKGVKTKNPIKYKVEKLVVKGTLDEIKKSDQTKKQLLKSVFDGRTNKNKHVNEFDLSRITINNVEIIASLGYGIKE
jgi:hypothetical protein